MVYPGFVFISFTRSQFETKSSLFSPFYSMCSLSIVTIPTHEKWFCFVGNCLLFCVFRFFWKFPIPTDFFHRLRFILCTYHIVIVNGTRASWCKHSKLSRRFRLSKNFASFSLKSNRKRKKNTNNWKFVL